MLLTRLTCILVCSMFREGTHKEVMRRGVLILIALIGYVAGQETEKAENPVDVSSSAFYLTIPQHHSRSNG